MAGKKARRLLPAWRPIGRKPIKLALCSRRSCSILVAAWGARCVLHTCTVQLRARPGVQTELQFHSWFPCSAQGSAVFVCCYNKAAVSNVLSFLVNLCSPVPRWLSPKVLHLLLPDSAKVLFQTNYTSHCHQL